MLIDTSVEVPMGKSKAKKEFDFHLEGRLLDLLFDGAKLKYIKLSAATGEYLIKVSKELRHQVESELELGTWIHVSGLCKLDLKAGKIKLKAYEISTQRPEGAIASSEQPPAAPEKPAAIPAKASILVCQKSDCMKRGGRAVCQALDAALSDRDLTDQVKVKGTGCMKHCKAGPNIVFMPDKTRYSRVDASEIPDLIDRHFPTTQEQAETAAESASETPTVHYSIPLPNPENARP